MVKHARKTGKRALAICMSILMLLTSWVFVAPTASAVTAGNYTWTVKLTVSDNGDCNDNDGAHIYVKGKSNNGTGSEVEIKNITCTSNINDKKDGEWSYTTSQFPTAVYMTIDYDAGGWRNSTQRVQIYVGSTEILDTGSFETGGGWLFGHEKVTSSTTNVASSKYPKANSVGVDTAPGNLTVPTSGNVTTTFKHILWTSTVL